MTAPKRRGVERGTIAPEDVLRIIFSQPRQRDRIALLLLFRLALRKSGNLKLAQQLARHRTIQTTADIYGHLDDIDLERALEAVASLSADDHSLRDHHSVRTIVETGS